MLVAAAIIFLLVSAEGALLVRVLRGGAPVQGAVVSLGGRSRPTDREGVVLFPRIESGHYAVGVGGVERRIFVPAELVTMILDLEAPSAHAGRFGRFDLTSEELSRLPHAGTVSSVLETLEPFAITNRVDVAGIESATDPLWSVRGSSWTQNRVLVDGLDVTDPAGGSSLLYPDIAFFEEVSLATSAQPPDAAGPGAELHLVTRRKPDTLGGTVALRYTGSALQSENVSERFAALGVEPRELLRFPSGRFEIASPRFYAAVNGFDLSTRFPVRGEDDASLVGFTGKLLGERWSLLGIAQGVGREAGATETFQVAQASFDADAFRLRLGFARGSLEDRDRTRWTGLASREWLVDGHLVRAGVELSKASETVGAASRIAAHAQDALFLGSFSLSPGLRLDWSRSGPIRWTSLSGSVHGGVRLAPSTEVHFSAATYPHVLTTRPLAATRSPSSVRRNDFTSIEEDLPRPRTDELTVGVEKRFRRGFLRFSAYQRWERNLLQTRNVGIRPSSYERREFLDVGVDGVLGTADDTRISVFDQIAQFGEDLFVVTHPEGLDGYAQGLELLAGFEHGRLSWRLSARAYRDVGSGNVGNGATENDPGVLGDLFDDPNTATNAEGRLFFDRAYTGKLALTAEGPEQVRIGAAIRYWDGQPFARHLFFPDLGQGPTIVQAFPRGRLRYAFNMTVDVRIEREILLGPARLSLAVDVFNAFNQALHTAENVASGPRFREPTAVQPARTVVLEGKVRF